MSVLICSTTYGGCGFIGKGEEFFGRGQGVVVCPVCREDHNFQITEENIVDLTNDDNYEKARQMLSEEKEVTEPCCPICGKNLPMQVPLIHVCQENGNESPSR